MQKKKKKQSNATQRKKLAAKRIQLHTGECWLARLILTIIAHLLHGLNRICMCNRFECGSLSLPQISVITSIAVSFQLSSLLFPGLFRLFIHRSSFIFVDVGFWIKLCGLHQSRMLYGAFWCTPGSLSPLMSTKQIYVAFTRPQSLNSPWCFYRLFNSLYLSFISRYFSLCVVPFFLLSTSFRYVCF